MEMVPLGSMANDRGDPPCVSTRSRGVSLGRRPAIPGRVTLSDELLADVVRLHLVQFEHEAVEGV